MVGEAKYCTKCDTLKMTNEFSFNITKQDGYQDWCKDCNADYAALRRARFVAAAGAVESGAIPAQRKGSKKLANA